MDRRLTMARITNNEIIETIIDLTNTGVLENVEGAIRNCLESQGHDEDEVDAAIGQFLGEWEDD